MIFVSVLHAYTHITQLPWWLSKNPLSQCGRDSFDPWVGRIPWRRKWQPTPVVLPGKSHWQSSLVGYSPWGHRESDTTERLSKLAGHDSSSITDLSIPRWQNFFFNPVYQEKHSTQWTSIAIDIKTDPVVVSHLTGALRSRNYLIPEQTPGWVTQIVNEKEGKKSRWLSVVSVKNNFLRHRKKTTKSILPNKLTSHNLLAELGTF